MRRKRGPILVCGIPSEPPMAKVIAAAFAQKLDAVVFNQRLAHRAELSINWPKIRGALHPQGSLVLEGKHHALEDFKGVYVRLIEPGMLPEHRTGDRKLNAVSLEHSLLVNTGVTEWLELTAAHVMNRHGAMASNMSKPYQAQTIVLCGLMTPPTLVTNAWEAVEAFRHKHGCVIYKSTSAERSIVRELGQLSPDKIKRLRDLPTQFQAYIPGINIRVHVVGSDLFATEICSEAVDYRYASRDGLDVSMKATKLPEHVANACLNLSTKLHLPLCGIDLKRTPSGDYYCFEVNPSPAFSYYQDLTAQPISAAIVTYLAG
jgi:glutathione synthase/RimK-type ligase-like ATP-grasp enzyme